MITKGIVEQLIDKYTMRVRVPIYNRAVISSAHTPTDELGIATISVMSGCTPNVRVGDVVFVSFEDNDLSKPVILGYLYRDKTTETLCDLILSELQVNISAKLPDDTEIGKVSGKEISYLQGATSNIQWQLDVLSDSIQFLNNKCSVFSLTGTATNCTLDGGASYSSPVNMGADVLVSIACDGANYKTPATVAISNTVYTRISDTLALLLFKNITEDTTFSISGTPVNE